MGGLDETLAALPTLAILEAERRLGWRKAPLDRSALQPGADEIIASCYAISKRDFERALRFARQALALGHPSAGEVLGLVLFHSHDFPAALRVINALVGAGTFTPNLLMPAAEVNMAIGDFRLGAKLDAAAVRMLRPPCPAKAWEGESLAGKKIMVMAGSALTANNGGMGYGDEIMWARFAPELAKKGASVYLKCSPALSTLFATLESTTVVVDVAPRVDFVVEPLELAYLLQIPSREVVPSRPYLKATRPRPAVAHDTLNVGISWGCGLFAGPQTRWATLSELRELADIEGVTLYSLEKGPHAEQLEPPPEGMRSVVDLGRGFRDFSDSAAAIDAMDLIVSADNVVANIAGALGKPLFVLGDYYLDWRFMGPNGTTPWYPTARVFKQDKPGVWRPVVARVAAEIRRLVAKQRLFAGRAAHIRERAHHHA